MNDRKTRALRLTALGLVGVHFLVVVLHSFAHEILAVKATTAQLAFIVPFIIVAPLAAGLMLPRFARVGAWLLLVSMLGSLAFGLYYHFVADTIDHVAHVARLRPAFWSATFQATAYTLAASEVAGAAAAAGLLAAARARRFEHHAARTGF